MAIELWETEDFVARQLVILIMDGKQFDPKAIESLDRDMQKPPLKERTQLIDWLLANRLTRDKKSLGLIESWEDSPSPLQRRAFWYYQARLRWVG